MTGQETTTSSLPPTGASGGSGDLESLKQEILSEMRLEMNKMKSEIIAGKTAAVFLISFDLHNCAFSIAV